MQHICRYKYIPENKKKLKGLNRKLEKEHIDFLLSEDTLRKWAGFTMKERVILFHRRFMNKKIAITSLRRLYQNNKVKRKKIRQHKGVPQKTLEDFPFNRQRILEQLAEAERLGQEVIYQDEIGFS